MKYNTHTLHITFDNNQDLYLLKLAPNHLGTNQDNDNRFQLWDFSHRVEHKK